METLAQNVNEVDIGKSFAEINICKESEVKLKSDAKIDENENIQLYNGMYHLCYHK
jgi:hypothetical protein